MKGFGSVWQDAEGTKVDVEVLYDLLPEVNCDEVSAALCVFGGGSQTRHAALPTSRALPAGYTEQYEPHVRRRTIRCNSVF